MTFKRLLFFFLFLVLATAAIVITTRLITGRRQEVRAPAASQAPASAQKATYQINLKYDKGTITLNKISFNFGFLPDYKNQPADGFICQIVSKEGKDLYSLKFSASPPLIEPAKNPLQTFDFFLLVPYFDNASEIIFRNPQQEIILRVEAPIFRVGNEAFQQKTYTTVVDHGDPAQRLDILYIADNYSSSQIPLFQTDVDNFYRKLFSVEPFSTYSNLINIHRIDNTSDLGCGLYQTAEGIILICNTDALMQLASTAPHDVIVVILNEDGGPIGGISFFGLYCIVYRVASMFPDQPANSVHEIAHTFASLADEYVYPAEMRAAPPTGPNCTNDPTCSVWKSIPGTGCFLGCTIPTYYRPTQSGCIMDDGTSYFCPVCNKHLISLLSKYGEPTASGTPTPTPSPTPTSSPTCTPNSCCSCHRKYDNNCQCTVSTSQCNELCGSPTPTPTPSPTPIPSQSPYPSPSSPVVFECGEVAIHDTSWNRITDFSKVKVGQTVFLAVFASQDKSDETELTTKARFRINGGAWQETDKEYKGIFYIEYTIPQAGSYKIEAMVYNPTLGWR